MNKTKEELHKLQEYVGKTCRIAPCPSPFDYRPLTLSEFVDRQDARIKFLEERLKELEKYFSIEYSYERTQGYKRITPDKKGGKHE